jgi:outer membrane protein assembly factor BamB
MYGPVSARTAVPHPLPYASNLINLLVIAADDQVLSDRAVLTDVARVLVPRGMLFVRLAGASPNEVRTTEEVRGALGEAGFVDVGPLPTDDAWIQARKPWPAEIDEWTHFLHGADGNPVAQDRVVGPPRHYQWVSGPMFQRSHETDSSVSTLVTAQGRLFSIVDEAPISLTGQHALPDKWSLIAQDAFNGVQLWKVPIRRWGWREWKDTWFTHRPGDFPLNLQKRLVAAGDKVYVTLGYQAPVSQLQAATGELLRTYEGTERCNEILHHEGTLLLSLLAADGVRVAAVDSLTGQMRWRSERSYRGSTVDYLKWTSANGQVAAPVLDPSLNTATDGNTVALLDGADVVALDAASGWEKWRTTFPQDEADRQAGGIRTGGNLWIGTMIVQDGVVLHASPHQLAGLSCNTGEVLWKQSKKYIGHLWYEWKDVFVIDGLVWTWSAELGQGAIGEGGAKPQRALWPKSVNGYDLHTGVLRKEVSLGMIFNANHHHRCYRNKATVRYILASRRGTEFVDLEQGHHTVDNWVRGTCHLGMMPANGLQYAPPHPCACYIDEKLNGMLALAPATSEDQPPVDIPDSARVTRGPAFGRTDTAMPPAVDAEDWPAFRHDAGRSGAARTALPETLQLLWQTRAGQKVSAPTVAVDRVYTALVHEHGVACVCAADGTRLWEFLAGGRIDSPPTCVGDRIYFGSAEGAVYCLRAADGQLVWRFEAAPRQRQIAAFGQLESAWPVSGSVLVQNGRVFFAAGRSSHLDGGLYLFALDAVSGDVLHRRRLEGPSYDVTNIKENFQLPMGALPDVLLSDGTTIFMRGLAFDESLQAQRGQPELQTKAGLLEDTYFKRMPWTLGGQANYARLIVHDNQSAYYVRMFDSLRGLDPTVFFTPGDKGYLLFARNMGDDREHWAGRIHVRVRAMALVGSHLCVAGPPDVVDSQDPLGAFEGRLGGQLHILDADTGRGISQHTLASPPVFNGIAAAHGRLFLTHEDGSISCFGKR